MAQLLTCPGPTKRFPGFCPQGLRLLRAHKSNPRRKWNEDDQKLYEFKITNPLLEMVCSVTREFARFARNYATPPAKAVFRIFGETASPRAGDVHKTHPAAIWVHKNAEESRGACFYFHFTHNEAVVLGGAYSPQPDELLAYRTMLQRDYREFQEILCNPRLRSLTGELQGDQFKRVPAGFSQNHPAADLLRRKQWYVVSVLDVDLLSTERLLPTVVSHFEAMAPLVEFLNRPLNKRRKFKRMEFHGI
jgi:uncharacterized protein (TIGR02453 family)